MRISHLFKTLDFWRAHLAVNREPVWENILPLFFFHRDGVLAIQRLAREWTRLYGLRRVDVFREMSSVRNGRTAVLVSFSIRCRKSAMPDQHKSKCGQRKRPVMSTGVWLWSARRTRTS